MAIKDYLNDPRIVNDPQMIGALEPIRRIHAIRLKIQDETAGMTEEEKETQSKKRIGEYFASIGLPPPQYVDFSGQGKLKPGKTVGA
jgi:hypothetical protein